MICFDKLWETMKEKQISQYRLIRYYGVSAGQLGRLKKNMYVSTHTVEMLCDILECRVEDVFEYRPDKSAGKENHSANTKEKEVKAKQGENVAKKPQKTTEKAVTRK